MAGRCSREGCWPAAALTGTPSGRAAARRAPGLAAAQLAPPPRRRRCSGRSPTPLGPRPPRPGRSRRRRATRWRRPTTNCSVTGGHRARRRRRRRNWTRVTRDEEATSAQPRARPVRAAAAAAQARLQARRGGRRDEGGWRPGLGREAMEEGARRRGRWRDGEGEGEAATTRPRRRRSGCQAGLLPRRQAGMVMGGGDDERRWRPGLRGRRPRGARPGGDQARPRPEAEEAAEEAGGGMEALEEDGTGRRRRRDGEGRGAGAASWRGGGARGRRPGQWEEAS